MNITRDWPAKDWEAGVLSDIKQETDFAGLAEIDELVLSEDDWKIRFWTIGLPSGPRCAIIRRRDGRWMCNYFGATREYFEDDYRELQAGLDVGRELEEAGLFTMDEPNVESSIDHNTTELSCFEVQARRGNRIRSFRYGTYAPIDGPVADIHRILDKYRI